MSHDEINLSSNHNCFLHFDQRLSISPTAPITFGGNPMKNFVSAGKFPLLEEKQRRNK